MPAQPAMIGSHTWPIDWLRPDWPAPPQVRALCTTRAGGCSAPPWDSFNLGDHVGDDPRHVATNRAELSRLTGAQAVFLQQVHGTAAVALNAATPDGTVADAAYATQPGIACTIMVADCLPILLTDAAGSWVAAVHAGWRGLAGAGEGASGLSVLQQTLRSIRALAVDNQAPHASKNGANEILAWLGPCIGPTHFEVGPEVREAFLTLDAEAARCFQARGGQKYWADLAGLARQQLRGEGVARMYGNDSSPSWCTVSQPRRFFSYRRDQTALGGSGRMAACIWLDTSGAESASKCA